MNKRRVLLAALGLVVVCTWSNAATITAKAWLAKGLISKAWHHTLLSSEAGQKPWPWADTWPVAVLRHPYSPDLLYVLEGGFGSALAFGPGHIIASAMPGESGVSVIAGHRDTHFDFLQQLQPGNRLQLQDAHSQWHTYVVASTHIVDSREGEWALPEGAQELHLITCYPFDAVAPGGPMRYVVVARKAQAEVANRQYSEALVPEGLNDSDKNLHNRLLSFQTFGL